MHSMMYIRRTLLGATSAVALCIAAPVVSAQTTQTPAPTTTQPGMTQGNQQDLQQSIQALEQARDQFASAKQGQSGTAQKQAQQALEQVETKLNAMPQDRRAQASKSIDVAKAALQKQQANASEVTPALDRVIADVRMLHQQAGLGELSGNRQAATDIRVEQKSPQVNVQQPAPQVTVTQPPPQVTVQQPQPKVTVEQPQPKVSVDQAEPKVTVQQQGQPTVTVQKQGEPQVNVQKGQQQTQNTTSPSTSATQPTQQSADQGGLASMGRQLVGKDVYGADNRNMGDVEDVVMGANGQVESILVDVGGFLGLGARRVAIPISQIQLGEGDRLTTTLTEAQAKELPPYTQGQR
jgi:hypothetical protein